MSTPTAPRAMSKGGKQHWRKVVKLLDAMGVLTSADLVVVERYCETLALWRDCREFLAENGLTYPVPKWNAERGEYVESAEQKLFPQTRYILRFDTALLAHERELGLTPSARSRICPVKREPGGQPGAKSDREQQATFRGPRLRSVGGAGE